MENSLHPQAQRRFVRYSWTNLTSRTVLLKSTIWFVVELYTSSMFFINDVRQKTVGHVAKGHDWEHFRLQMSIQNRYSCCFTAESTMRASATATGMRKSQNQQVWFAKIFVQQSRICNRKNGMARWELLTYHWHYYGSMVWFSQKPENLLLSVAFLFC